MTGGRGAVLSVPAHGAGQRHPLGVAADGREVLRAVRVAYDTAARRAAVQLECSPPPAPGNEQAAGYCCDQPPGLLSQTFAASKFCSVLMYTALCTYDACVMSCSGEVIG